MRVWRKMFHVKQARNIHAQRGGRTSHKRRRLDSQVPVGTRERMSQADVQAVARRSRESHRGPAKQRPPGMLKTASVSACGELPGTPHGFDKPLSIPRSCRAKGMRAIPDRQDCRVRIRSCACAVATRKCERRGKFAIPKAEVGGLLRPWSSAQGVGRDEMDLFHVEQFPGTGPRRGIWGRD